MKSLKLMTLGICFILFGGVLFLDSSTSIGGIDFFIMLIGLILSIVGFLKNDN